MHRPRPLSLLSDFSFDDAVEILERRRWWLLLGALVGLGCGVAAYLLLPAEYESTTSILVEPQRVPESYIRSTITVEVEQRLNTLHERVTGYANLNELINVIGEERLDPSGKQTRESIMGTIRGNLFVDIPNRWGGAPVFEVSYTGDDPEVVADVVREVANLFISENLKDRAQQAAATAEFLDRELERLREDVEAQEERVRRFRFEHMGSLPTQLETNLRQLDRLNAELASNLESQEGITQRVALLKRQLAGGDLDAPPRPGSLSAALQSTRASLIQAQRAYTDEHPTVKHLERELERLQREIRDASDEELAVSDPAILSLRQQIASAELELASRKRQEGRIRDQIEQLEQNVRETPESEQEYLALTRDYENLVETYRDLLSKKYDAALARNLEQAQKGERFKLLRPAQVPGAPSWPDPKVLLPAGLAGGLALVLLLIGIGEFRNPAFRSVDRLTRMIGLPVFASIPRIAGDHIYEQKPGGEVDPKLVVHTAPESAPAEQYRGFLPILLDHPDTRVILITSAARGDGKSLTTMNLACTLAQDLNKRVLVIDGDLRRPTAHRLVHTRRDRGLSDVLRRHGKLGDCAVNSKIPNLSVLPAGPTVRNPLTLLTDVAFLELLAEAKLSYDLVLIDAPPLLPVVDTKILRKMADMVLFVVRADATPREGVVRSLAEIRDVAGVVFNEVSPGSFRRYYYYDAYSRYAYGDPAKGEDEARPRG